MTRNEEILNDFIGVMSVHLPEGHKKLILEAMAISNKEAATGFAHWAAKEKWVCNRPSGLWFQAVWDEFITGDQLYEKYTTHLNTKQP